MDAGERGDGETANGERPSEGDATDWDAVFWDVGGVVLNVDSVKRAHYRFLERLRDDHDVDAPIGEVVDTWRETVGEHFREREGTEFRSAVAAYEKGVAAIVGEPLPESAWRPTFEAVAAETLEPNPGARETLAALAELDLHVGVLSDADRVEVERILSGFDVLQHFDSVTVSEDVGRTKPDPAMFEAALEASGADPERSIMIGDRYRHDVEGAAAFGMTTVAHGADDGEAVDYRVEDLREVLDIVHGER